MESQGGKINKNLLRKIKKSVDRYDFLLYYITRAWDMWHSKLNKCDSGVVGNARPCQGRDRGFEPRLSLLFNKKKDIRKGCPFFVERAPSWAQSSSVFVPLRSAQSRCPPDTLRRLSLLFNKKRTSGKDVLFC